MTQPVPGRITAELTATQPPAASSRPHTGARYRKVARRLLPVVLMTLLVLLWAFVTRDGGGFMRATPAEVAGQAVSMAVSGLLFRHIGVTLLEVAIGYVIGVSLAFWLGYSVSRIPALQSLLLPYLIGLQAVPMVAIAPILITYLGPGILTNGIICALIVFFPMLITTNVAFRTIHHDLRDLMRSLSATRWQTFTRLELPAALPTLFGGLKVSTSLAVIGAVVGEGVSAEYGLGYLVYYSRYVFNQSSVLVGLFTLMGLAFTLYALVARIERRMLRGRRR